MGNEIRTTGPLRTVVSTVPGDPGRGPTASPGRGIKLELQLANGSPHFAWAMTLEGAEDVARMLTEQVRRTREVDAANVTQRPASE